MRGRLPEQEWRRSENSDEELRDDLPRLDTGPFPVRLILSFHSQLENCVGTVLVMGFTAASPNPA